MEERTQPSNLRHHAVLAWLRLARIFQKIDTRSERFLRGQGLSVAQFDVLSKIGAASGMTQQELADSLLVTKGNVSQLLRKMEDEGLIMRRQEGRTNCLFLTAQGQSLYDAVVPQQEALIADLLSPLTDEEQRELARLLRKLDHSITA